MSNQDTSWQKVSNWYNDLVDEKGHYYHQHIILPNITRLMKLKAGDSLLDLACGQGVLARAIPKGVYYTGLDLAPKLLEEAKALDKDIQHHYLLKDVTKPFELNARFKWITVILALQNTSSPYKVIANASKHLDANGKLIMVLNHPCFRIPKRSEWGYDEDKKLQYRRIDGYMKRFETGIVAHPGKDQSAETVSYHYPISAYVEFLHDNGMVVESMEEWVSDKSSTGGRALAEDRAREEFPLFLMIVASKKHGF